MKVVQVRCPVCDSPIYSKQLDTLIYCDKCSSIHVRGENGPEKLDYEIAEFAPNASGERTYLPFWRMYCSFVINSKKSEGGALHKLSSWLKGDSNGGNLFIYVPAWNADTTAFRQWSSYLTVNSPKYSTRLNFNNIKRVPASVSKGEAHELADFVVVTMEAEKPGVLQYLDYKLTVNSSKVVYLPFVNGSKGMTLAIG